MKKLLILNGPNLNLQGMRQPEVYGSASFEEYIDTLRRLFPSADITYYQSNVEGELVNKLQEAGFTYDGIILNAGAYSHTSIAIHDCIAAIKTPVVEVHISNIYAREAFRHHDVISSVCKGMICGMGLDGYRMAVEALLQ